MKERDDVRGYRPRVVGPRRRPLPIRTASERLASEKKELALSTSRCRDAPHARAARGIPCAPEAARRERGARAGRGGRAAPTVGRRRRQEAADQSSGSASLPIWPAPNLSSRGSRTRAHARAEAALREARYVVTDRRDPRVAASRSCPRFRGAGPEFGARSTTREKRGRRSGGESGRRDENTPRRSRRADVWHRGGASNASSPRSKGARRERNSADVGLAGVGTGSSSSPKSAGAQCARLAEERASAEPRARRTNFSLRKIADAPPAPTVGEARVAARRPRAARGATSLPPQGESR